MFLEILVALLAVMALALGVLLLMRLQEDRWRPHRRDDDREIIVRESPDRRWWNRPLGPYYSHLPIRPLLY